MADIQTAEMDAELEALNMDGHTLYADRSSTDEQLSLRPVLWKTKNMNLEGN
jgi:hypothetical protein